jgi:hypothetical protein
MMQLGQLFQEQQQLMSNPAAASLVRPENVYNLLEDQVKVFNKAQAGRYFTNPTSDEAKQAAQQQQEQQAQQMQMQQQMQQMQMQLQQGALELEKLKAQNLDQNTKMGLDIKQQAHELNAKEHEDGVVIATAELAMEAELEREQGRPVALG